MGAATTTAGRSPRVRPIKLTQFQAQRGVHCETTMLRNMLHHAGVAVSEPMLFGLGQGIDFQYVDAPDPDRRPPMLTGRIGPGEVSRNACAALGVELLEDGPTDEDSAHASAVALLEAGHVVGVTVDIYHLDYFASRTHFSAHCIALHGLDDSVAHIVDTEQQGGAQELAIESLRRARASNEGYLPSPNHQLHLGALSPRVTDDLDALLLEQSWPAMRATAQRILDAHRPRSGVAGLRLTAYRLLEWADTQTDPATVVREIGRFWRFAGTGGTNFRGLFRDFLREVETRSGDPVLAASVQELDAIHGRWTQLIDLLMGQAGSGDHHQQLTMAQEQLLAIADAEERAFGRLLFVAIDRTGARS